MRNTRFLVFVLFLLGLSSFALSWPANGRLAVCTTLMGWQSDQYCVSDGKGGIIIGWHEDMGGSTYQAYIQRYNKEGQPLWGNNVPLWSKVTGVQNYNLRSPSIASFQNNDIAVCWYQSPRFVVQRFNLEGEALWNNGEPNYLNESFDSSFFIPQIVTDDKGNCFVRGNRQYEEYHKFYKFDKEGLFAWGTTGIKYPYGTNYIAYRSANFDYFSDGQGVCFLNMKKNSYLYFLNILKDGNYGLNSTGVYLRSRIQWTRIMIDIHIC